jgi:AraC-like DNA-binding protein
MSHHEFYPCAELAADIQCFWASQETGDEFNQFPIIPDSYVELIFNCGAPIILIDEHGHETELPPVFMIGLQQKPLRLRTNGDSQIISARFFAWAARPLLELEHALSEMPILALNGIWQDLRVALQHTLSRSGEAEAIACLETFVLHRCRQLKADLRLPRRVGQLLYETNGNLSMNDLAERCYLSPSQFQRRMKQTLGMPAKTYARLIRYEQARNALFLNPRRSIADLVLVYEFGYTDQSHLIHEFKAFTSHTPGELATYGRHNAATWVAMRDFYNTDESQALTMRVLFATERTHADHKSTAQSTTRSIAQSIT